MAKFSPLSAKMVSESHEIEQYEALDSLKGADRQWFPAFMGGDAAAAPFPWAHGWL